MHLCTDEDLAVRPAKPVEMENMREIAYAAYEKYVDRIGRRPAPMDADFETHIKMREAFVVDYKKVVAGYIILFPQGDHIFVENVAVQPSLHGLGIGKVLLDFAEKEAARFGLRALELYTNALMTENLEFYDRMGLVETDRRVEDGFDRVFFRKTLKRS